MTKLEKIRKVYGSFSKAVEYYVNKGASMNMTARALGMDRRHFLRTVRRYGLRHLFKTPTLPECQPWGAEKRITDADLLGWVAKCRTTRVFKARAPHSVSTVYDRFGSWFAAKDLVRQERLRQRHIELYGIDSWREHGTEKTTAGAATRPG